MIILVLNCGSSSIKYQVLKMQSRTDSSLLAKGLVERIGMENGTVIHNVPSKKKLQYEMPIADHKVGIREVLKLLCDPQWGAVKTLAEIETVGHRVAHGGEYFSKCVMIDDDVIAKIQSLCTLAPLHNPVQLMGIRATQELLPHAHQVAVFDTSFHQTMPDYAYIYAIPYEYYKKYGIRRYGFHGISHGYVAKKACQMAGLDFDKARVVTCHLGNGGSVTAIKGGKSVDTSMGFTPLEGMVMGTRCGDLDPSVVTFLQEKEHMDYKEINEMLNKKSGFLGIYGQSSDCRDLNEAEDKGDYRARLALDVFRYRVLKYVGAYAAVLGGVDLIAFIGGIGENDTQTRAYVCERLQYLGGVFDAEKNKDLRGCNAIISKPESKIVMTVVHTDEEWVIANLAFNLIEN